MKPISSTVGWEHPHKFGFVEISDEIAAAVDGGAFVSIKVRGGRRKLAYLLSNTTTGSSSVGSTESICPRADFSFAMGGATAIASGDNAVAEVSVVSGGDDTDPIEIFASRSMVPAVGDS
jgi:hypothetical protein